MNKMFVSAVILALAMNASAKTGNKEITYLGTWDCGQWREATRKNNESVRQGYLMWVTGFLSGTAIALDLDTMLDNISSASVASWMDNYCQKHPLDKLVAGAAQLSTELRLRSSPSSK